jgi:hypothetical protein
MERGERERNLTRKYRNETDVGGTMRCSVPPRSSLRYGGVGTTLPYLTLPHHQLNAESGRPSGAQEADCLAADEAEGALPVSRAV